MKKVLKKFLGDPEQSTLKRYAQRVKDINQFEAAHKKLTKAQLGTKTVEFRGRLKKESLDALLPEVFSVVREAASRTLNQRHYDVQMIGGICLHEGKVAEMKTGEGKTLVATLPLYLNALTGKGSHLVTVNDYLAQIGAGWMAGVYHMLGMSVGIIIPEASMIYDPEFSDPDKDDERLRHLRPCSRQEAYAADITYGTNNEFGFDYLRDNMVRELAQLRQRELNYAIVDEVDSILIDEARTPLIISQPSAASSSSYQQFARIAKQLDPEDYVKEEKHRSAVLTDLGVEKVEKLLGVDNLYATANVRTIYHLEQAMRAELLFTLNKNYVVTNAGEVVIVDEFTGRLLPGRRYNEGLHQAIEAKEGVEVQQESMTLAKVSFQNLFRLYDKLAGMTGTAATEKDEFYQIYKLDVISIPTNEAVIRRDHPDAIYRTETAKFKAIVNKVAALQKKGQPVLLGTSSIEKNEHLSKLLTKAGVKHSVLNAKNNTREALIVAGAGQKGAVTLATNIAGRGTDIVLGKGVTDIGGLFVIGTERHESRRIDNQLRGRAGRQGDPGESHFFVSTEDDIMRIFNGELIARLMDGLKVDKDTPIESKAITKALEAAQKKVEGMNFDSRKNVVQYDDVMNKHRLATYATRRQLLENVDVSDRIKNFVNDEAEFLAALPGQDDDYEQTIVDVFPFDESTLDRLFDAEADRFEIVLRQEAEELYGAKQLTIGADNIRELQHHIYFQVLDQLWMEHLENMEHMQQGIHWISIGQRDPLVEFRRRAQILYEQMQQRLRHVILKAIMNAQPVTEAQLKQPAETKITQAAQRSVVGADRVVENKEEIELGSFRKGGEQSQQSLNQQANRRKQARKRERQNRRKGRR